MNFQLAIAKPYEAAVIAALRNEVADNLTHEYGRGQWSWLTTEATVKQCMKWNSKVLIAKLEEEIVGTACLQTRKPWSINTAYFTPVKIPLYLVDLAVRPRWQRKGIGKFIMNECTQWARSWPADAIRLDAYDGGPGASRFYELCGYAERGHAVYRDTALVYFELLLDSRHGGE